MNFIFSAFINMSLFDLPTSDHKADSGASQFRFDEINPISSVAQGSTCTFEINPIGNNWMIPKLSYIDVRLKVLKGTAIVTTANGTTTDFTQFKSYPASHIVTQVSHSVNGSLVESQNDCSEISAIQVRSMLPYEYNETFKNSYRIGTNVAGAGVASAGAPSLAPWDGTATTFSCFYQPPSAMFKIGQGLPGLRQRIVLTLASDYKNCLSAAANHANYVVTLDSIKLYACMVVPDAPIAPPRTVVLSLPMMNLAKQFTSGSSQTQTYSIAPSTDKVYVVKNSATIDGTVPNSAHVFQSDVQDLQVDFAGQRQPNQQYENLHSGSATRNSMRAFLDYAATTGTLVRSRGLPDTETTWRTSPIYGFTFLTPPNSVSTSLTVRSTVKSGGASGNICVAYRHHKNVVISYNEDGIAESANVQENIK